VQGIKRIFVPQNGFNTCRQVFV